MPNVEEYGQLLLICAFIGVAVISLLQPDSIKIGKLLQISSPGRYSSPIVAWGSLIFGVPATIYFSRQLKK
jgi:hypothetical protein